jgi:hypothetical protein
MNRTVKVQPKKRDDGYLPPPYTYSYATLDAIISAITPALSANEIAHMATYKDGILTVSLHWHAQWISSSMPVPFAGDWQRFGSARTYCWRYLLAPLAGVSADYDDDGSAVDGKQAIITDPLQELWDVLLGIGVHPGEETQTWVATALGRKIGKVEDIKHSEIPNLIAKAKAPKEKAKPEAKAPPTIAPASRLNRALAKLGLLGERYNMNQPAAKIADDQKAAKLSWANGMLRLPTAIKAFAELSESQVATLITAAENGEMPTNPNDDRPEEQGDTFPTDME